MRPITLAIQDRQLHIDDPAQSSASVISCPPGTIKSIVARKVGTNLAFQFAWELRVDRGISNSLTIRFIESDFMAVEVMMLQIHELLALK